MSLSRARLGWLAIAVALIVVANPELRAFLLLADAIGMEVMLLLFAMQFLSIRATAHRAVPAIRRHARAAGATLRACAGAGPRALSGLFLIGPFTYSLAVAAPMWVAKRAPIGGVRAT